MSPIFIAWAVVFIAVSAISFAAGYSRGKAVGWLEHHFADIAKDRARRDRAGKFLAIKGGEARSS